MGQRNFMGMDQQAQGYPWPMPSFPFWGVMNFQQPNIHPIGASYGNTSNLNTHPFSYPFGGSVFLGMPQFNNGYMPPLSNAVPVPVPLNHGSVIGVSSDSYGRNGHIMDDVGDPHKRKNTEGVPAYFQYHNASASSSSSGAPFTTSHAYGGAVMYTSSFALPQFSGNGMTMLAGSEQSERNGLGSTVIDPVQAHGNNSSIQGHFVGQPFHPSGASGGGASSLPQSPAIPYMHGRNVNGGYVENRNMAVPGYFQTSSTRSSSSFPHPPPSHLNNNIHYPLPFQEPRDRNVNLHPQVPETSHRVATNNASPNSTNPSQDCSEIVSRNPELVPPTSLPNTMNPSQDGLEVSPMNPEPIPSTSMHNMMDASQDGLEVVPINLEHVPPTSLHNTTDASQDGLEAGPMNPEPVPPTSLHNTMDPSQDVLEEGPRNTEPTSLHNTTDSSQDGLEVGPTSLHNTTDPSQDGLEVGPWSPEPAPLTSLCNTTNPSQDDSEVGSMNSVPIPSSGPRLSPALRRMFLLRLRSIPPDQITRLRIPISDEAQNSVDHNIDMRLDTEDMSYEELLELGERIGNVKSGLSEEAIIEQMKTRTYVSLNTSINLEEAATSTDQESDSCIICQFDYIDQEKIGKLGCGHEYHAACLKKWLLEKNVCPICKSDALRI